MLAERKRERWQGRWGETIPGIIPIGRAKHCLEVDPWSAVEPVPFLCAVNLNSSCEKFSEPRRMSRGTHFKRRSLEVQNKFSILTISEEMITVLTRCSSFVFELI